MVIVQKIVKFIRYFLHKELEERKREKEALEAWVQCDQIGRYIGLLGNFLKPLATINLPKAPTFLRNFCKGVKIYHFSSEIIFGQLL